MVLLHLVLKEGACALVINVEHGIRGEESENDSRFVADFCVKNNIPYVAERVNAAEYAKKSGDSLELSARKLRYGVFEEVLASGKADCIALAHHAGDNSETVLMRIVRGTGVRGLCGIVDSDKYIHPLLSYTKEEIERYAADNGIPFVIDSTNLDNAYTRNFLRNEILKPLRERFPDIDGSFARLAKNAAEAEDFISASVIPFTTTENGLCIPCEKLKDAHPLIAKRSVQGALAALGAVQDIEFVHYGAVLSLLDKENGASADLPYGIGASVASGSLFFYKKREYYEFSAPFSLNAVIEYGGYTYSFLEGAAEKGISFDPDKIPPAAVIRTRKDGDVFKRCNGRTKKLGDYLNDIKFPLHRRGELLVIADGRRVLAVLGVEISDGIKITEKTEKIYTVKKR